MLKLILKTYHLFISKDKEFTKRLRQLLGYTPSNIRVFRRAFSHKSSSKSKEYGSSNNERLEYLGDAVLGTIVAEYLFRKYPNADEGFLTKMRSKIVKRKALNEIGDKMGLDEFLTHNNSGRLSRSMLGNALEALVGAVYLDTDYRYTQHFVISKILRGFLDVQELETFDDNYKSQLLEWCQKNRKTIKYEVLSKSKMDNRDRFKVAVLIGNEKKATAEDFSKKSAEQLASHRALITLGVL